MRPEVAGAPSRVRARQNDNCAKSNVWPERPARKFVTISCRSASRTTGLERPRVELVRRAPSTGRYWRSATEDFLDNERPRSGILYPVFDAANLRNSWGGPTLAGAWVTHFALGTGILLVVYFPSPFGESGGSLELRPAIGRNPAGQESICASSENHEVSFIDLARLDNNSLGDRYRWAIGRAATRAQNAKYERNRLDDWPRGGARDGSFGS